MTTRRLRAFELIFETISKAIVSYQALKHEESGTYTHSENILPRSASITAVTPRNDLSNGDVEGAAGGMGQSVGAVLGSSNRQILDVIVENVNI